MKKVILLGSVAVLAGCGSSGSGGGGGGGGSVPEVAFTSWDAIAPNTTTVVSGTSQEVSYTADAAADRVLEISAVSPSSSGATYKVTTDANNVATRYSVTSAGGTTVNFSPANGDVFGDRIIYHPTTQTFTKYNAALTQDGTSLLVATDPDYSGWDYQSYGVWITGRGQGSGTAGAASIGNRTVASNIPSTGNARFVGSTGGLYVDPTGASFITASSMVADVSFADRTVGFVTRDTVGGTPQTLLAGGSLSSGSALNMTGSMTYAPGSNSMSGTVSTASGMTGTINGAFFGPNASEIGGTFATSGSGIERYAGGFGGKR